MKSPKLYFWLTRATAFDHMTAGHVLDILRYDGARVENSPQGFVLFSSVVHPKVERLRSYHVEPTWLTESAVERDHGISMAWEAWHRLQAKAVKLGEQS